MDAIPQEVLCLIALELPVADVRRFRLVDRRFAHAGFPALVRELTFLNTLETADAFRVLTKSPYALLGAARHLTIYDGVWPVATSHGEWASHFLSRRTERESCTQTTIQHTYRRYQQFIEREASAYA